MKKVLLSLILTIFSTTVLGAVVLIDPGHGGEDCGAKAKVWKKHKNKKKLIIYCEKDLALDIAKKIHKKINKSGYIKAYLTRSVDRTLTLQQRADYADKVSADIFISVHLNSFYSRHPRGVETYYLDNHNSAAVRKIESVENKGASEEEIINNKILADLVIQRTAPTSRRLAKLIHKNIKKEVVKKYDLTDRGTKKALFYVLALSKRPSVLLEAGFLSNEKEILKLKSKAFQEDYANAVYKGVKDFFGPPKKKVNLF